MELPSFAVKRLIDVLVAQVADDERAGGPWCLDTKAAIAVGNRFGVRASDGHGGPSNRGARGIGDNARQRSGALSRAPDQGRDFASLRLRASIQTHDR